MPFLELSLTVHAHQQTSVESALTDLGALSIALADAHADTPDERAIFEPGVGETPLWDTLALQALFDAGIDRAGLVHALCDMLPGLTAEQLHFRDVADSDWTRAWLDTFKPMRFGRRLWIYPWTIEPPDDPTVVAVRLDPGLAFGSGTHPTTALCLEWLDAIDLASKTVIDFGCGSGVLAIAALKLGAARAMGVDNDAQAITASADNAQRNGVAARLDLYLPQNFPQAHADILVANILAGPLAELAPQFARCVRPGGWLALSGLLESQRHDLLARYAPWFEHLRVTGRDGWLRIDGVRRALADPAQ